MKSKNRKMARNKKKYKNPNYQKAIWLSM